MKPSTALVLDLLRRYPEGVSPLEAMTRGAGLRSRLHRDPRQGMARLVREG